MVKGTDESDNGGSDDQPVLQKVPKYLLKLVVAGEAGCGKTSLMRRFVDGFFTDTYTSTIGVDFSVKNFHTQKKELVKLQIWDLAGQERYRNITNSYYRGANGMLFVYDVTDSNGLKMIDAFLNEAERFGHESLVKVIVGNKADLNETHRKITHEEGQAFADGKGLPFFETSARDNIEITECFNHAVDLMVDVRNAERAQAKTEGWKSNARQSPQQRNGRDPPVLQSTVTCTCTIL